MRDQTDWTGQPSTQPDEHQAEIWIAWNELGDYDTAPTYDGAIERLQEGSDGVLIRCKRYVVPVFLPVIENGGELEPTT